MEVKTIASELDNEVHGAERKYMIPAFKPGDMIRIRSGPFNSFLGKIDGINQAKSLLKIAVKIFGNTRIVLKFSDVEKVSRPR